MSYMNSMKMTRLGWVRDIFTLPECPRSPKFLVGFVLIKLSKRGQVERLVLVYLRWDIKE